MVNFGPLAAVGAFWAPLQMSTGVGSWQRYCTPTHKMAGIGIKIIESKVIIYKFKYLTQTSRLGNRVDLCQVHPMQVSSGVDIT